MFVALLRLVSPSRPCVTCGAPAWEYHRRWCWRGFVVHVACNLRYGFR